MPELVPVAPDVLVWARQSALATVAEAAERTGRDPQTVLDWEAGRELPTYSQLEHLADEYGISVNVLLLPERPHSPEPPPDFRSPTDGQASISRRTRRELRRARHLQALLGQIQVLPQPSLPDLRGAADAAAQLRRALGVTISQQISWHDSNYAFRQWRTAFSRLGIVVLQHSLPLGELQGLSLASAQGGPPVILINQSDWINARNFTLLHELGHLVLADEGGICDPWRQAWRLSAGSIEARCHRLAGAVLVPGDHLREQDEARLLASETDVGEKLKHLRKLSGRYKVSDQVVWYRAHDIGLVSNAVFRALWPLLRPPTKKPRSRPNVAGKV
jgi:Zn-dependent peptidase ImmA (M78 family)